MKTVLLPLLLLAVNAFAQNPHCDNNPARAWWDTRSYRISLEIDTATGYLEGNVTITAVVTGAPLDSLQIDLMEPLEMGAVTRVRDGQTVRCRVQKTGALYYLHDDFSGLKPGQTFEFTISYKGLPLMARHAPWDGGLVLSRDGKGKRWIGLACQGQGASIWMPCKDFQGDEPDSVTLALKVPEGLSAIGNGKLVTTERQGNSVWWSWKVHNPINLYDITFYIGDYAHWTDTLQGAQGVLSLDYYVLRGNEAKAKKQFAVVKPMLHCFEAKLGPYPFYSDGYKLVESPYLGMEHQSAIAYGNRYKKGYLGKDRSRTGAGLDFDYIIVHESGHEWFGNNITSFDKADTWLHEGFTTYTETIFEECLKDRSRAFRYQQGKRYLVRNDRPVQGGFNACDEGSGDHYEKGAFLVHMMRMIMDNDAQFFAMLRAMNLQFYHSIVSGKEVETFMSRYSGINLSKIFDQYLRERALPELQIMKEDSGIAFRWTACVPGFDMPVLVEVDGKAIWLRATETWQELPVSGKKKKIKADPNFLVNLSVRKE